MYGVMDCNYAGKEVSTAHTHTHAHTNTHTHTESETYTHTHTHGKCNNTDVRESRVTYVAHAVRCRWPLKLGWHAVKNPTQIQLHNGISHEAARVMEMRFFASSVWAHTPGSYTQTPPGARLGTVRLRHALARLLSDLTASAVPRMLEDAQVCISHAILAHTLSPLLVYLSPTRTNPVYGYLKQLCLHACVCVCVFVCVL